MLKDSQLLFDVVTSASHPTEKRQLIDMAAAREACNRRDLSNMGLVAGHNNMADGLTKPRSCPDLYSLLWTEVDASSVEQWIMRPGANTPTSDHGDGEAV